MFSHPLTLATFAAVFGIITYACQAHIKRRDERHERRRKLYESLIEHVFRLLAATPGDESSKAMTEIEKSWLFASDGVLRACYQVFGIYEEIASGPNSPSVTLRTDEQVRKRYGEAVAALFVAMRDDLRGCDTTLGEDWARQVVKVYFWGAPAAGPEEVDSQRDVNACNKTNPADG